MLINRIDVNILNELQKDQKYDQLIKFIDEKDKESGYDFRDDIVIISLDQVRKIRERTNIHSSIIIEYLFFHEIGHKNDPDWRIACNSDKPYKTLDKEILELSLSRYLKFEQYANDYAKDHIPSYIEKIGKFLHQDYNEILDQTCNNIRIELEQSIKWFSIDNIDDNVRFSDEDIKKYKLPIKGNIIKIIRP